MKKTLLIIQPGAYGDLFICAPIAKFYHDKGYQIFWPIQPNFLSILQKFNYVIPIILSKDLIDEDWLRSDVMKILNLHLKFDKVINLADRGPHPTEQKEYENFEQCKYRISEIDIEQKHNLQWNRNIKKENELYEKLNPENSIYDIAHIVDSHGNKTHFSEKRKTIFIDKIQEYDIIDWYKLIINAQNVYCIESSIHQFVDGFIKQLKNKPVLLKRSVIEGNYRLTLSKYWDLSLIGENTIIKG